MMIKTYDLRLLVSFQQIKVYRHKILARFGLMHVSESEASGAKGTQIEIYFSPDDRNQFVGVVQRADSGDKARDSDILRSGKSYT